jgi:hypothetical protein
MSAPLKMLAQHAIGDGCVEMDCMRCFIDHWRTGDAERVDVAASERGPERR